MSKPPFCTAWPEDSECEWCWVVFGEGEVTPADLACHCGMMHSLGEPHAVWLPAHLCVLPGEREGWSACHCLAPMFAPDDMCDCMDCVRRREIELAKR